MKIGIDLRRVAPDGAAGLTHWLRGALSALFARDRAHRYVLFTTVYNYHLFADPPASVERRTLPTACYADELQNVVQYEGDYDLLLRAWPDGVFDRFPLSRQIVCFTDLAHEAAAPGLPPDQLRRRRRDFRAHQAGAGAVAVPSESARRDVLANPWTAIEDVFAVAPGEENDANSWAGAADALLAAFGRVAERAAAPRMRVEAPPVVSVVTPSFNQGAFIRKTIDSVLAQDYPHIDYQVIDGGSTDDTVEILKGYGARLRWVSERDRGQAHAINKGMARAKGQVLAYLNSDDLLRPGAVSRVVDHFRRRPACDLVYGRDVLIDVAGGYLGTYPTADYSFERLVECCCISQPAAFWRKRLADQVGPFDESLQLVMDYDYWLRADRAGGVLEHVPDVLAHTRIHRQAKTGGSGDPTGFGRRFYRELFATSFRHAGYVSTHYVHVWLYATLFTRRPWARRHQEFITRVVQKWYHNRYRCGLSRPRALELLLASEWEYLGPYLHRLFFSMNPRRWLRAAARPVKLEPDLWLGPELTAAHAGGPVRLAGVPARDGVLRVFRGSEELAAVPLRADEPADVCLDAPPGPLRLAFSASEPLPDGRRVSFKLHGTTLFTEGDAA